MFKKLIQKMVGEALAEQSNKPDQSAAIKALETERDELKAKLEAQGTTKRLAKLKEMAAGIPDGAQGMGVIAIIEDGVMKNVPLKSKKDLTDIIDRAEKNEIEVFLS